MDHGRYSWVGCIDFILGCSGVESGALGAGIVGVYWGILVIPIVVFCGELSILTGAFA